MGTSGLRDVPSFSRSATCVVQSACIVITQGAFLSSFHRFEAILTILVPQVVQLICENHHVDEITATRDFYESGVYSLLEKEENKVWHFSPHTLFAMYDEERRTGTFTLPEET